MCGIAGLYAFSPSAPPVDRAQLRTIRDHMAARGPDGHGEWFSENGRVAFGHRRLAIIDLSEGGAQPMHSADGQLVITFNGEIYNYRELRRELESQGHVFRTGSDTEVLLHLYRAKGVAMLQDLRGMYAFALWDAAKQALLLARDPFGIKPLYYTPTDTGKANSNGTLRFASQVKALLAGGHVDTAPEPAGHAGFFLWGSVPAPYTLYRGIRALPAGHYLWVSGQGATEPVPFCQITDILAHAAANPARGTPGDALDAIGAAVRDSIAAHHVADVPVGMFLSAGIDSALITALSVAHGECPHTLTLAFAEYVGSANDESPLPEQLAAQFGTRHATVMVHKADFAGPIGHCRSPHRRAKLSMRAKRGNPRGRFEAFSRLYRGQTVIVCYKYLTPGCPKPPGLRPGSSPARSASSACVPLCDCSKRGARSSLVVKLPKHRAGPTYSLRSSVLWPFQ